MKVNPHYGESVIVLPGTITKYLGDPKCGSLAVLLYTMSCGEFTISGASHALGISEEDVLEALNFWRREKVISTEILPTLNAKQTKAAVSEHDDARPQDEAETADEKTSSPKKKRGKLPTTLPTYTSEETADHLERQRGIAFLIDSCEQIIGKIFSTAEVGIIVGLMDHLSLNIDYILLLFAHAEKVGKKSVRYVEKLAIDLTDRDVIEYGALAEELAKLEATEDGISFVRKLYGIGRRTLSEKEKKMIRLWYTDWNFENEIIKRAYEITVNNTSEASLPYSNAILESWHKAGLSTLAEIDECLEKQKADKPSKKQKNGKSDNGSSSFDTDDFFEAALKRSYGD